MSQKRVNALYENVRSKNLKIVDLNRQLKAANEMQELQAKQSRKKQRDMAIIIKNLDKELKEEKDKVGITVNCAEEAQPEAE